MRYKDKKRRKKKNFLSKIALLKKKKFLPTEAINLIEII